MIIILMVWGNHLQGGVRVWWMSVEEAKSPTDKPKTSH